MSLFGDRSEGRGGPPPHRFDPHPPEPRSSLSYWQTKRLQWTQEQHAPDAFSQGGLFSGLGQRGSPHLTPAPPSQSHIQPPLFPPLTRPAYPSTSPPASFSATAPVYMSGLHELRGGPSPAEATAKRETMLQYQATLQAQMREKEERVKREKQEKAERERREEEDARNYNPWGRGGGGAPMRDETGHILANRKQALQQALAGPPAPAAQVVGGGGRVVGGGTMGGGEAWQSVTGGGGRARVGLRSDDGQLRDVRVSERSEWQRSLALQIEEKKQLQQRQVELQRDEEKREEERVDRERERLRLGYEAEKAKEAAKARAHVEEEEAKRRKKVGQAQAGLTDYEKEQQMKGRQVVERGAVETGVQEERKEVLVMHASLPPAWDGGGRRRASAPVVGRGAYGEMEMQLDRLRAEVATEAAKVRERREAKRQRQRQRDQVAALPLRRPGRRQAAEEGDVVARFMQRALGTHQHTERALDAYEWRDEGEDVLEGDSHFIHMSGGGTTPRSPQLLPSRSPPQRAQQSGAEEAVEEREEREREERPKTPESQVAEGKAGHGEEEMYGDDEFVTEEAEVEYEEELTAMMSGVKVRGSDAQSPDDGVEEFVVQQAGGSGGGGGAG